MRIRINIKISSRTRTRIRKRRRIGIIKDRNKNVNTNKNKNRNNNRNRNKNRNKNKKHNNNRQRDFTVDSHGRVSPSTKPAAPKRSAAVFIHAAVAFGGTGRCRGSRDGDRLQHKLKPHEVGDADLTRRPPKRAREAQARLWRRSSGA